MQPYKIPIIYQIFIANNIQSSSIVLHIQREMALHLDYCASFGLSKEEIEVQRETIGEYHQKCYIIMTPS